MKINTEKVVNLLKQPSTWRGIIIILSASGVGIAPALALQIVTVGTTLVGLIEVGRDENK